MRRFAALYVIPALFLALNGCGGGGGGGAAGKGGGAAGSNAQGGSGGAGGTTGGSSGGTTGGVGGSGGVTGGSGGATAGSSGGAVAGVGGATGGSGGATGGSGGATGGSGGSTAACGDSTDGDSGLSCNSVDATGPCVIEALALGSPPAPTGGQMVAGTYDLTARTVYNVPDGGEGTGNDRRETVVVTGSGTSFTVEISQVSGTSHQRQSGTATISGDTLTFMQTCPPPGDAGNSNSGALGYDANGVDTFTIHDMGGNGAIRLNVYKKR
jgi:hypothetical protein